METTKRAIARTYVLYINGSPVAVAESLEKLELVSRLRARMVDVRQLEVMSRAARSGIQLAGADALPQS